MAHFAKIEDGIVTTVVVVDNEHEANGNEYLNSIGLVGTWAQTSYNSNFGKKFAAVGDAYNAETGEFKPAAPFASWVWNETEWSWEAPTPKPTDGEVYVWDEPTTSWVVYLIP